MVEGSRVSTAGDWLTVRTACAMLGVSPATLRRWSDAGEIEAFTTPGGHRRFSRSAVLRLLPTDRRRRGSGASGASGLPGGFHEARPDRLTGPGRLLLAALREYLDGATAEERVAATHAIGRLLDAVVRGRVLAGRRGLGGPETGGSRPAACPGGGRR